MVAPKPKAPRYLYGLERVRKARGISRRDLANLIGASKTTIDMAEQLNRVPLMSTVQKLAEALRCRPAQLFARKRVKKVTFVLGRQ